MTITAFIGQETSNLFSRLSVDKRFKLRESSNVISFDMVVRAYIEEFFLKFKTANKEEELIINKCKELASLLVDTIKEEKKILQGIMDIKAIIELSQDFDFFNTNENKLMKKDKVLQLSEEKCSEVINEISSGLFFEWLEDEILKCANNGSSLLSYKILFEERYKYSGIKLKLFHFDRENKINFIIKHLKKLNYSVKKRDIIKRNIFFKKKIVGFKFEISWDE
ncbi:hypothetical protein ACWNT8_15890 (plasmid) [Pigmentibacter ruber]